VTCRDWHTGGRRLPISCAVLTGALLAITPVMALRAWVSSFVLGLVACSGSTASSEGGDGGSTGGSSGDSSSTTASASAGGSSGTPTHGSASGGSSSSSSDGSSSDGSSSDGSSSDGSSSDGASAVTSGQGGNTQTVGTVGGDTGVGGTSNHDQPDCDSYFDELDRSCQSPDDCTLVQHQTDCCGGILVMGIASSSSSDFSAVEQYCAAQFPACGCAARGLELEDGTLIDFGSSAYAAECVDGRCRSRATEETSACGPQLKCTATQYCSEMLGGPAGSEPSYNCLPLGDCSDCACLEVVGCQCIEDGDAIRVSCAAP